MWARTRTRESMCDASKLGFETLFFNHRRSKKITYAHTHKLSNTALAKWRCFFFWTLDLASQICHMNIELDDSFVTP